MPKKISYAYVKEYINSTGCELLSEDYINNKTNLKIQCSCGEIFYRCFQDFKNKQKYTCTMCSGNKLRYNDVKQFIEEKGCKLLSNSYKNSNAKLHIECSCGNDYYTSFNTFKKDKQWQCQICGEKLRISSMKNRNIDEHGFYTIEKVKFIIESNSNSKVISRNYNTCFDKLEILCECGEIFHQTFSHINNKIKNKVDIKCPKCMKIESDKSFRFTIDDMNNKLSSIYGEKEYIVINCDGYKNINDYVTIMHLSCGNIFKTKFKNMINMKRLCKKCQIKFSRGVVEITKYLEDNNINYIREKTFKNCRDIRPLPFDFYLLDHNIIIEFDGEQHFKSVNKFGGEDSLFKIQKHDKMKNDFCLTNNIKLLRIKYDEVHKIKNILDEFIYRYVNTEIS